MGENAKGGTKRGTCVVLILANLHCAQPEKVASVGGTAMQKVQSIKIEIDRATSPWTGYTGSAEEEQAGRTLACTRIDPSWEVIPYLRVYGAQGVPIIAIDRKMRRVVLSRAYFRDSFYRADATRLRVGEKVRLGQMVLGTDLARDPSRLELFLLQSHLVLTYAHMGSSLEKVKESQSQDGMFHSEWQGNHTYFTSQKNESPLHFAFHINLNTGEIEVEGL
jgi:hypothetical protein